MDGTSGLSGKIDFDDHVWGKAMGYKYGLKFVKVSEENDLNLKQLVGTNLMRADTFLKELQMKRS